MFISELISLFLLGLLSSLSHCVGMCGGFVYCYATRVPSAKTSLFPHLTYNLGRITTYTFLGAVFGFLSQTTKNSISFLHWQVGIQTLAGILMFIMGLEMLGFKFTPFGLLKPIDAFFSKQVQKKLKLQNVSLFSLGLLLGTIPCGLVYTAGLKAAASGHVLKGAALMLSFGLGTMPALLVLGWGGAKLNLQRRQILFRMAGILILIMSIMTLNQAWQIYHAPQVMDHHHHHH